MTLGQIYQRVMWLLYGDANYPTSTQQHMQSMSEGIILQKHKKIQEDYDYWFMEDIYHTAVSAGMATLPLPPQYKSCKHVRLYEYDETPIATYTNVSITNGEVTVTGGTLSVQWSGKYYKITASDGMFILHDVYSETEGRVVGTQTYTGAGSVYQLRGIVDYYKETMPYKYGIDIRQAGYYYTLSDTHVSLYPPVRSDGIVEMRYYAVTIPTGIFESYTDRVTEEAADALIYMAVEEEERRRRNFNEATYYRNLAEAELQSLKKKHIRRQSSNVILLYRE